MYDDVFPAPAQAPATAPTPGPAATSASGSVNGQPRAARQADDVAPLRAAYAWQRRIAGATVLGFFALYVLLTVYVPSATGAGLGEGLNLGLVLGLLQLPVTVAALIVYERTALRRIDPLVDRARARREEGR
ncbi:DUF485 domain-containing protein [Streptomyces fragilis]|uniref:DUF485 domain-containing protein n=1 Tax=Streptomyces fragilis TaxID=67301 RepID=UPI000D59D97C|nr:DUF485 domain-containing protein [Streptomyces fragilis]